MAHWAVKGVQCVSLTCLWRDALGNDTTGPAEGTVCTVIGARRFDGDVYISLEEHGDYWFLASAFRPLVKRSQEHDVAMFAHLLNQNDIHVPSSEPVA